MVGTKQQTNSSTNNVLIKKFDTDSTKKEKKNSKFARKLLTVFFIVCARLSPMAIISLPLTNILVSHSRWLFSVVLPLLISLWVLLNWEVTHFFSGLYMFSLCILTWQLNATEYTVLPATYNVYWNDVHVRFFGGETVILHGKFTFFLLITLNHQSSHVDRQTKTFAWLILVKAAKTTPPWVQIKTF